MTTKSSEIGNGSAKFTPDEKADIANAIDALIATRQNQRSRAPDKEMQEALDRIIKRLQDLFIKVRQEL